MTKSKQRGFVVTDWNINGDEKEKYDIIRKNNEIKYIGWGKETCPSSGRLHNQAFIYFYSERSTRPKNLNKIGNIFGPKHCYVAPMKGNFRQNTAYCSKESELEHSGDPPEQGARGDLRETIALISKGSMCADDVAMLDPISYNLYKKTYEKAEDIYQRTIYRTEHTEGIWYYGKSGIGKSHEAFKDYSPKTHYVKPAEDWWDGYKGQETVIINEFRENSGHNISWQYLMELTDKWPMEVKRRGRTPIPFTSKRIIITSPEHPKETFCKSISLGDNYKQLKRRFKIVLLDKRYSSGNIGAEEKPKKEFKLNDIVELNIEERIDLGLCDFS